MAAIFNALVYNPLYNGLVFLIDTLPWADVGVVVAIFTIIVKLILFPLAQKSVKTQIAIRAIDGELRAIREKYKDNKEEQARRTMALYKDRGINPFAGFLLILIQLPIIFALYFIFVRGGLPTIHTDILYSFVPVPETVDVMFLGLVNLLEKSVILALLTGLSQFLQAQLIAPSLDQGKKDDTSLMGNFTRSMHLQVKYVMPVIITVIAYTLPAIVPLYWTTSNVFTIVQELVVRKRLKRAQESLYSSTKGTAA